MRLFVAFIRLDPAERVRGVQKAVPHIIIVVFEIYKTTSPIPVQSIMIMIMIMIIMCGWPVCQGLFVVCFFSFPIYDSRSTRPATMPSKSYTCEEEEEETIFISSDAQKRESSSRHRELTMAKMK